MRLIRFLFNWMLTLLFILSLPLIAAILFIAIILDKIIDFLKHNKKYLLYGTNWITEVFK